MTPTQPTALEGVTCRTCGVVPVFVERLPVPDSPCPQGWFAARCNCIEVSHLLFEDMTEAESIEAWNQAQINPPRFPFVVRKEQSE